MNDKSTEADKGGARDAVQKDTSGGGVADLALVLIVGRSNVNRVVVARIVERAGLKPLVASPEEAARALRTTCPGTVILDGGPENRDCETLMARLGAMRSQHTPSTPSVILLSTTKIDAAGLALLDCVDAVVSKPILPEMLQPVVDRLLDRVRSH